jgi:hypothetical protein
MLKDRILTYSEELVLNAENKIRRETAKKMKELKIPPRQIAAVSGLPLREIKKL